MIPQRRSQKPEFSTQKREFKNKEFRRRIVSIQKCLPYSGFFSSIFTSGVPLDLLLRVLLHFREINGVATKLQFPSGLFVIGSEMFVTDRIIDSILVFNVGDNGNIAPKREINGAATKIQTASGLSISNNEIFISDVEANSLLVFGINDNGNVVPKREVIGNNTFFNNPFALFTTGTNNTQAGVSLFSLTTEDDVRGVQLNWQEAKDKKVVGFHIW